MNGNVSLSFTVFIWVLRAKFVCIMHALFHSGHILVHSLLCVVSDCLRLYACGLYFVFSVLYNVHSFMRCVCSACMCKWMNEWVSECIVWATNNFYSMRQLNWEIRSWLLSVTRRYTRSSFPVQFRALWPMFVHSPCACACACARVYALSMSFWSPFLVLGISECKCISMWKTIANCDSAALQTLAQKHI